MWQHIIEKIHQEVIGRQRYFPKGWKEDDAIMSAKLRKNYCQPWPRSQRITAHTIQEETGTNHYLIETVQIQNRTRRINRNMVTTIIFLDVAKSFDRVGHNGLVQMIDYFPATTKRYLSGGVVEKIE